MPRAWPTPAKRSAAAAPEILAMHFSSLDVRRPAIWRARFSTSTNVRSVEVRSNLFAIEVPRIAPGRFDFALEVFDVPPIFLRAYRARIIARNRYGAAVEEDVPFRIR